MFIADPAGKTRSGGLRIAAAGIEQQAAAVGKDELGLSSQRLDVLARLKADADSGAVEKGLAEESGAGDGAAIIRRDDNGPDGGTGKGDLFILAGIEVDRGRSAERRGGNAGVSP